MSLAHASRGTSIQILGVRMMNPTVNWSSNSEQLRSSVEGYIEHREHPGDFLAAVASNDLLRAAQLADKTNRARLADIADFSDCMRLNAVGRKQIFRLGFSAQGLVKKRQLRGWVITALSFCPRPRLLHLGHFVRGKVFSCHHASRSSTSSSEARTAGL